MASHDFDVLIVGSGLAGLSAALHLAPTHRVAVITKRTLHDGSSGWAQGGIAAVLADDDSFAAHIEDTLVAGAGLCDLATTRFVVELQEAWRDILKRAKLVQHHKITREELSVREYMSMVLKTLQGRRFVEFEELFEPEKGSTVLVVTFIALLELAKETLIEITQAEAFAPIYVRLAYTPV